MKSTVKNIQIITLNGKFFREGVKKLVEVAKKAKKREHFIIQLRDIVKNERGSYLDLSKIARVNVVNSKPTDFLKKDDVLIALKGVEKKAFLLKEVPYKAIATNHFLILRSPNSQKIMPEFIEYILNSKESQKWLYVNAGGSYSSTLNKKTLSKLPFPDISIENQRKIIALNDESKEEKKLLLDLIENREQQIQAFATKIIKAGN
jgi:restriction endonuclease S subunit